MNFLFLGGGGLPALRLFSSADAVVCMFYFVCVTSAKKRHGGGGHARVRGAVVGNKGREGASSGASERRASLGAADSVLHLGYVL